MDDKTIVNDRHFFVPARRPGANASRQRGFTLNEFFVLLGVVAVIIGLAIPGILRERAQARNEAAAIQTLQSLIALQTAFAQSCGAGGYASDIAQLQSQIAQHQSGYSFAVRARKEETTRAVDCRGVPTHGDYVVTAEPNKFRSTGRRSFAATRAGTIWQVDAAKAPSEPFAESAIPVE